MTFKKVGRNGLRCVVSPEEMWESGMQVDDFLQDRDKTEEFIRDVVEKARNEVGFECSGDAFSVQISLMSDSSVVLMISNEDMGVLGFLNQLREQLALLHQNSTETAEQTAAPVLTDAQSSFNEHRAVIALAGMDEAISVAKRLNGNFDLESALYKHDDMFYLVLDIFFDGSAGNDVQPYVMEYYYYGTNDEVSIAHVREFGKLLIPEEAVEVLATL